MPEFGSSLQLRQTCGSQSCGRRTLQVQVATATASCACPGTGSTGYPNVTGMWARGPCVAKLLSPGSRNEPNFEVPPTASEGRRPGGVKVRSRLRGAAPVLSEWRGRASHSDTQRCQWTLSASGALANWRSTLSLRGTVTAHGARASPRGSPPPGPFLPTRNPGHWEPGDPGAAWMPGAKSLLVLVARARQGKEEAHRPPLWLVRVGALACHHYGTSHLDITVSAGAGAGPAPFKFMITMVSTA